MKYAGKIESVGFLSRFLKLIRPKGVKIVFTNGCFDILHSGHVEFLRYAKSLGHVLVVGLDTDSSLVDLCRNGKKDFLECRPVRKWWDRAKTLEALEMIDFIIPYDSHRLSQRILLTILPDIYVKGGDWKNVNDTAEGVIMSNIGRFVMVGPYVKGKSTTEIISRIKNV